MMAEQEIGLRLSREAAPSERQPRILLIDDDEAVRLLLSRVFQMQKWRVTAVGSGREALEAWPVEGESYDAIVMDINMPGMDGYQTFRHLRERHPEVRCLFISGRMDENIVRQIEAEGLTCLAKPVPLDDLIAHIRRLLE